MTETHHVTNGKWETQNFDTELKEINSFYFYFENYYQNPIKIIGYQNNYLCNRVSGGLNSRIKVNGGIISITFDVNGINCGIAGNPITIYAQGI